MRNLIRAPAVLVGQLMKKIQDTRAQGQLERKSPSDNPRELGIPDSCVPCVPHSIPNACLLLSSISFYTFFSR